MVEICPKCGSLSVSLTRRTWEGRMTTIYYGCDRCGDEWREKRYR